MPYSIATISRYKPSSDEPGKYCSICKYYRNNWCMILLRTVNPGGYCRFFQRSNRA